MKNIGVDLVDINRINKVYQNYGMHFVKRILGINELFNYKQLEYPNSIRYLAKRFAAKEAVSKALGTGIGKNYKFTDIEILNNSHGLPYVKINEHLNYSKLNFMISLSDEPPMAIAFAMVYS